jgi:hypothetical protein
MSKVADILQPSVRGKNKSSKSSAKTNKPKRILSEEEKEILRERMKNAKNNLKK